MKKKRTKKYPIFTYLCYLLAVAALVTSVTFSRYSVATSGSVSTQVALYNCSYEIDGFSSFAFNNTDFYIMNGNNLIGNTTARTVRFTMRNYKVNEEGKPIEGTATDVNVQGSIRLRVPAELGDKLAIQLTDATAAGASSTVVTPQIVLGELLYARVENGGIVVDYPKDNSTEEDTGEGDTTEGDTTDEEKKQVIQTGTEYADFGNRTKLETVYFSDYEERTNNDKTLDQEWTVSGGLKTDNNGVTSGSVTVVNDNKAIMTITAETDDAASTYSVGFRRVEGAGDNKNENAIMPQLFLDLDKEMTFYTVELDIPTVMQLTVATQQEHTFDLYLALTDNIQSGDLNFNWTTAHDSLLTNGGSFNGATVTGYHFDYDAAIYKDKDGTWKKSGTTQIRVQKTFATKSEPEKLTFHHVAPISETTVSYVHPIEDFYKLGNNTFTKDPAPANIAAAQSLFGLCSQFQATRDEEDPEYYISFAGVPDNPFYLDYAGQTAQTGEGQSAPKQTTILMSLSKSFYTSLTVVFTQTSLPRPQGGAEGGSV